MGHRKAKTRNAGALRVNVIYLDANLRKKEIKKERNVYSPARGADVTASLCAVQACLGVSSSWPFRSFLKAVSEIK